MIIICVLSFLQYYFIMFCYRFEPLMHTHTHTSLYHQFTNNFYKFSLSLLLYRCMKIITLQFVYYYPLTSYVVISSTFYFYYYYYKHGYTNNMPE